MSVYDRGSSYYYRFWKGGRLHERGGYPTRKAAQDAEWERRHEVRALRPRDAVRPPKRLHEAVQEYLTKVVIRHRNAVGERYTFRLLLERFAEDRRLDALTSPDLEDYVAWRLKRPGGLGRPISRTTVNRDLAHMSAFFSWCQDRGYVRDGFNPARARRRRRADVVSGQGAVSVRGVERFEQRFRPYIVLTPQQRRQLFALFPPHLRKTVGIKAELRAHVGVRGGVLRDLRWEQLDWRHRLLHYASKGSEHVIPLSPEALRLLKELGPQPSGPVFPVRTDSTFKKYWAKARVALGIPRLRPHDLRVMFARETHARGADLKAVQGLLGHSTPTMTMHYIPADLHAMRAAVRRWGRAAGRATAGRPSRTPQKPTPPPAD
jgi:integrase